MTPDEEAEDERIAIVADGCNVSQAEAERIVRGWREKSGRLDFTTQQGAAEQATCGIDLSKYNEKHDVRTHR